MKVRNKGFTITELVIVIAVIAILAAVLIPTFSNVIEKANESAASSACNIAVTEYITMVTLDSDPDNNDATGVVFSNDNYYYVYSGGKLHYIGNTEKDSAKLLAVTSYDTDISALTGFPKQSVEEGTAVYEGKMKFTIGEQTVEVDLTDTTRTLYLYNVAIDCTTYAGFFTINNTYGGSSNVIQTVNYSYQSGISQDQITVGQAEVSEEVELVLESISAEYLSQVPIYTGDNKTITPEEVKVTASYEGGIVQVLSSNLYTLENETVNTESEGQHTVTVVYSEGTSITTTFSVDVGTKQTKTIHYYNDLGWANPWAYVWYEEYIPVKPGVGDIVLMGNILSTENAWSVDSSIKMFYDSNTNQYVVKGLRIEQGEQFKIAKILESGVQYYNLNEANSDYKYSFDTYNDSNLYNTENADENITIEAGGLYDIYFKSGNVLYIEKSKDQTAENRPNVAIISTYSDGGWPGKEMTKEGNLGLWTVEVDARATYVVFNDESKDAVIGINKTVDIEISSNAENIYYDGGWHSEYTMYYFYNAHNWKEVYANATTTEPIALMSTSTTTDIGIRMTAVEGKPGWFAVPVASECNTIVFSDGTDVNKTEELTIDNTNVYYNPNNATAEGGGWSSSIKTTTYYFYNAAGWEKVYAHYWVEDGPGTTWHGVEMTPVDGEDGWFSIDIDDNFEKVVFNDGIGEIEGVNKTADLTLNSSTPYFDGYEWKSEQTTHQHSGGTATCLELATCEVCGQRYGKLGSHTLQHVEGVQPTCTESGIIEHWKCTLCEKLFSDSGAENEITNVTAPAKGHTPGSEWTSDGTNHWKLCTRCGEHLEESAHTGGTATCTEQATCEICNNAYGALGEHNFVNNVCQHCHSVKYYFYNFGKWSDVYAYAWTEEFVGDQPAIGEKVLICKTPDGIEYSFKLTPSDNEYVIQGLYLPEGTSVKVGKLEDSGNYFYYTLKEINEGTSTGKGTTELKLITTGMHDFYFSENYNNDKLWINKVEGNSSELPYFKKVIEFKAWPGTAMQDMGDGWWYVSIDAKAENIIFNGAIGETRYQTDNLTLNPVTPYYCINGWKDTPDISDIIVLDLTEANNWITTSPRFAVYLFNGASSDADNNGMWLDMTAIAGNSVNYYYAVDISGLDYSKFTVCRMNPESTENNWDNKWNQTVDLQLENGLCVKIKGWSTIEQSSFAKGSVTREV